MLHLVCESKPPDILSVATRYVELRLSHVDAHEDWLRIHLPTPSAGGDAIALSRPCTIRALEALTTVRDSAIAGKGPTPQLTCGLIEPRRQRAVEPLFCPRIYEFIDIQDGSAMSVLATGPGASGNRLRRERGWRAQQLRCAECPRSQMCGNSTVLSPVAARRLREDLHGR